MNSGTREDLIHTVDFYKGHRLVVRKKKDSNEWFVGTSTIENKDWVEEGYGVKNLIKAWRYCVDYSLSPQYKETKEMLEKTYEQVFQEWGKSTCKIVEYKNKSLLVKLISRAKDNRAFYVGETYYYLEPGKRQFCIRDISFESIHYDKVIAKFKRFVDEYCTDWQARASYLYKGYDLRIDQEKDKEFYIGYVQFHKNSTFKYIADSREEVEVNCKNRINRVIEERTRIKALKSLMRESKEERIKRLQEQLASITTQLEEVKKEKDTLIYKGVVLEYGVEDGLDKGWMIGRIRNALEGTEEIYGMYVSNIKDRFETYVDELEKSANIYNQLMGKEYK